jgi:hypothetical protein
MQIVKAVFLGIWLFSFGTIAYLYLTVFRRASGGMFGVDLITHFTTQNTKKAQYTKSAENSY